jgi:hypothetical protein
MLSCEICHFTLHSLASCDVPVDSTCRKPSLAAGSPYCMEIGLPRLHMLASAQGLPRLQMHASAPSLHRLHMHAYALASLAHSRQPLHSRLHHTLCGCCGYCCCCCCWCSCGHMLKHEYERTHPQHMWFPPTLVQALPACCSCAVEKFSCYVHACICSICWVRGDVGSWCPCANPNYYHHGKMCRHLRADDDECLE